MASTILGIDLGSYSVKVARLEAGFRSAQLIAIYEVRVPDEAPLAPPQTDEAGEVGSPSTATVPAPPPFDSFSRESLLRRQLRVLDGLLNEIKPRGETSAIAFSDEVTLRLMDLPLSDPKKVQQALPFELAGQLMTDIEDQVIDQTPVRLGNPNASGGDSGSSWVAACIPKEIVREQLRALFERHLDPRLCGATALATAALFVTPPNRRKGPPQEGEAVPPPLPLWVIDFGHRYTHICAVAAHPTRSGQVVVPFVRSIARGGLALTQAVARAHDIHMQRAEMFKHEHGLDESIDAKTGKAVREALRPMLRELRQTLAAYSSRHGERPKSIYLCGGGSELRGLYDLLQNELDIECLPMAPPPNAPWFGGRDAQKSLLVSTSLSLDSGTLHRNRMPSFALLRRFASGAAAVGLCLAMFHTAPQVNFRKGDLSYRTDYAFLREKAPYLAAFAVALLICIGGWVTASLHVLEKESERLRLRLISETTALFGEPRSDGSAVSAELQGSVREDKGSDKRIPQASALDLLDDISHAAPVAASEKGPAGAGLDVLELHIRPKKIELKATAASAQYVDDFDAALLKLACVKAVQKGKVLTVKNTGPDGKPVDVKQFSLELTTTCP